MITHFSLDNGHGIRNFTSGKRSPEWGDILQIFEGEYNRKLVKAIFDDALSKNLLVTILVPEDEDISITERARRSNSLSKNFGASNNITVSVHLNALDGNQSPRGWEVLTYGTTSEPYGNIFWDKAKELLVNCKDLGYGVTPMRFTSDKIKVRYRPDLGILRLTAGPALLTENLFMTNKLDCQYLLSEEGFRTLVNIHVQAMQQITAQRASL